MTDRLVSYLHQLIMDCWDRWSGVLDEFDNRKAFYKERRDAFRKCKRAMVELAQWKAQNNDYEYTIINGLIPKSVISRAVNGIIKPVAKCDTWFSEFKSHNDNSLVLSESEDSYVIGNTASYDERQYPAWFDANYSRSTPCGQAFGHTLVISRRRVFNVIDPEATANNCALLKEMRAHFLRLWNNDRERVIRRVRLGFDQQNQKLASKEGTFELYRILLPQLEADYEKLVTRFRALNDDDFVFALHAYPDNSIGHLHMHVFPRNGFLRQFSTEKHDWKTISVTSVLAAEEEEDDGAAYGKIQYSSRRQMEKARSNYAEAPPLTTVHETRVHALDSRRPTTSPPGL